MKKVALVIGMVVILVGLVMGGLALHASASPLPPPPTLKAWGSTAPGTVTITGTNWTPAVAVDLYMDAPPPPAPSAAYKVAVATPGSNGVFVATFTVGPTWVGDHHILAVQGSLNASAKFTITNTSQLDPRILAIQQGINDVKNGMPIFRTDSGKINIGSGDGDPTRQREFDYYYDGDKNERIIKHVSLTINTELMTGNDTVEIRVNADDHGTPYPILKTISSNGESTYQFDTDHWKIIAIGNDPPLKVFYTITTFEQYYHGEE